MERETEGYFFLFFFNFFLPHTVAASRFSIKRLSMRQNVVVSRGATAIQALYLSSELPSGIYTRLSACFSFSRSSGFFIGQILFPAAAIVVVSWISLWMDQEIGIQVSTLNLLKSSRARGVIFRFPTWEDLEVWDRAEISVGSIPKRIFVRSRDKRWRGSQRRFLFI